MHTSPGGPGEEKCLLLGERAWKPRGYRPHGSPFAAMLYLQPHHQQGKHRNPSSLRGHPHAEFAALRKFSLEFSKAPSVNPMELLSVMDQMNNWNWDQISEIYRMQISNFLWDIPTECESNELDIHQQAEVGSNQSSITTFILLGFEKFFQFHIFLFILSLAIYILAVAGNLLIIVLVAVDQHLHTPMYFFLMNLSALETCYISNILPRMLSSFLTGDRSISFEGCISQWYFFAFFGSTECYLLSMMSYDRYLAICKPLHYMTLMNGRLCLQLASTAWMSGIITSTIITSFMLQLTFCGPREIDHFFCDIFPLADLSCSNPYFVKLATYILGAMGTVVPFKLTLVSYICIISTVLRIPCKVAQQKAFSTCSSHLIVIILFYGSLFMVYVIPETDNLKELHKTFSLFYTVLTPILNPLIYSLRNREVKEGLCRLRRKFSNRVF
ncbi:olfactory receptor 10A7-like [Paroedura picta]|uniref:olfactory receptor 10A7-like n=1 Tax=Paroedura picta TaxID=143630 RepID=UPI0040577AF6